METARGDHEFAALRATIRERGTARVLLAWATIVVWAALLAVVWTWNPLPAATILPLLVLATGFEAVFSLHTGVERVGRYLQIFHEHDASTERPPEGWETTAMRFGQRFGGGADPLFCVVFAAALAVNCIAALGGGVMAERVGLGLLHLLVAARIVIARQRAARQRAQDLERFRSLRGNDTR